MNARVVQKRNRKILTVDDNPEIHEDYRKVLCGDAGSFAEFRRSEAAILGGSVPEESDTPYLVESAQQGQIASRMVKAAISLGSPYAVAFVDMRMPPGWDGIETIEHMWQDDPNLEVVICTAYADYSWEAVFERLGNTDQLLVLKKPFDPIEVKQLAGSLTAKWELARRVDPVAADVSVEPEAPGISEATKLLERYRELVSWLESTVGFGSEREPDGTRDGVVVAVRQYDEMVESLVRGVEAFGDIAKKVVAINEVRLRRR